MAEAQKVFAAFFKLFPRKLLRSFLSIIIVQFSVFEWSKTYSGLLLFTAISTETNWSKTETMHAIDLEIFHFNELRVLFHIQI